MKTTAMVAMAAIITLGGSAAANAAIPPRHIGFGQPGGPVVPPLPIHVPPGSTTEDPVSPSDRPVDGDRSFTLTMSTGVERAVSVTLTCNPAGGTHPGDVTAACEQLGSTRGDIASISPTGLLCTKQFEPVTARMHGSWDGREVKYERQFGNACEANAETGGVLFTFWQTT